MTGNKALKSSYKQLHAWYVYRAKQNTQSLDRLLKLLARIDKESDQSEAYQKEMDDLESLRLIYETGIRNFESQINRYKNLIAECE
jgi:cell division protein FtsB